MLSEDRLKHIKSVAEFMFKKANEIGYNEEKCEEMAVLGFLHDIGYMFTNPKEHAKAGGDILHRTEYIYWKEVYYHGDPFCEYASPELNLLNMADMSVDGKGNVVGFKKRLNDIEKRHGKESEQYINSKMIIDKLKDL